MYKIICSLILILLVVPSLPAQEKVSFDTITSRMAEQLNMYPQEKLHVHIDVRATFPETLCGSKPTWSMRLLIFPSG